MDQQSNLCFSKAFAVMACEDLYPQEWSKLIKAATIHGYGGISRGGKDGIFNILKESKKRDVRGDKKLMAVYEKLRSSRGTDLTDGGIPVKVVAHVPSGIRLVGVHYPTTNTTFILGLADYDGDILV